MLERFQYSAHDVFKTILSRMSDVCDLKGSLRFEHRHQDDARSRSALYNILPPSSTHQRQRRGLQVGMCDCQCQRHFTLLVQRTLPLRHASRLTARQRGPILNGLLPSSGRRYHFLRVTMAKRLRLKSGSSANSTPSLCLAKNSGKTQSRLAAWRRP